ncbi:MGMT family protein [Rhodohalobacter sp.]|uniref:MGMT family protein n=1 Tax=Rhodohalobacter sp. TaxID=1974210 RepID=UPI00356B481E
MHDIVLQLFHSNLQKSESIQLHLKRDSIPTAYRAVGSAVGQNSAAFIIHSHRVIASTGVIGNDRQASDRKIAMFGREIAQNKNAQLQ